MPILERRLGYYFLIQLNLRLVLVMVIHSLIIQKKVQIITLLLRACFAIEHDNTLSSRPMFPHWDEMNGADVIRLDSDRMSLLCICSLRSTL